MTPKFSLVTAVAALTVVLAAPAAWGQAERQGPGNLAISPEVYASTVSRDAAIVRLGPGNLAVSPQVYASTVRAGDTAGRNLVFDNYRIGAQAQSGLTTRSYPDVVERAVAARNTAGRALVFDNYRIDPSPQAPNPTQITVTRSDSGVEWPQVGIGFGLGLVLALGLGLAMRFAHIRPLAH